MADLQKIATVPVYTAQLREEWKINDEKLDGKRASRDPETQTSWGCIVGPYTDGPCAIKGMATRGD